MKQLHILNQRDFIKRINEPFDVENNRIFDTFPIPDDYARQAFSSRSLFPLGDLFLSWQVAQTIEENVVEEVLARHVHRDYGERVSDADHLVWSKNEKALTSRSPDAALVQSRYLTRSGAPIRVTTLLSHGLTLIEV